MYEAMDKYQQALDFYKQQHDRWYQWAIFFFGVVASVFVVHDHVQKTIPVWIAFLTSSVFSTLGVCALLNIRASSDCWRRIAERLDGLNDEGRASFKLLDEFNKEFKSYSRWNDLCETLKLWTARPWVSLTRIVTLVTLLMALSFFVLFVFSLVQLLRGADQAVLLSATHSASAATVESQEARVNMDLASNMTVAASIYTLFFAISWGIVSNALPRWKPFHYAMLLHPLWDSKGKRFWQPTCRLLLSWVLLNIIPWCIFVWDFAWLQARPLPLSPDFGSGFRFIMRVVVPGLVPFALYRLWLVIVQWRPTMFYAAKQEDIPEPFLFTNGEKLAKVSPREPDKESLGILSAGESYGLLGDLTGGLLLLLTCLPPYLCKP